MRKELMENGKMTGRRETLIAEYLELLRQTESDPARLKRFSDPVWLQEITDDNLKTLVEAKMDLLETAANFVAKYTPKG